MPIVLDTHAWIWWITSDRRLPPSTRRVIDRHGARRTAHLSLISIWEIAKKVEKGQIVLDRPLDAWLDVATSRADIDLVDLSRPVLLESCRLPAPFHGDPADQIIVATARVLNATIVTKDERIQAYTHARTTW